MMTSERRAALITGALLIAGIALNLTFTAVEHPVLATTASLAKIPGNQSRLSAGGLIEIATAAASVGIAIALYPVLRRHSEELALAAVVFRTIEAVMYTVAALVALSLPSISQKYAQAAASGRSQLQAIADALTSMRQDAILAAVLAYITGAVIYYSVMYRARLIPRWLTGWGIAAALLLLTACLLAAFSRNAVTSYTILIVPIAAQELAFAAWLILRGFDPRAQNRAAASLSPAVNPDAA